MSTAIDTNNTSRRAQREIFKPLIHLPTALSLKVCSEAQTGTNIAQLKCKEPDTAYIRGKGTIVTCRVQVPFPRKRNKCAEKNVTNHRKWRTKCKWSKMARHPFLLSSKHERCLHVCQSVLFAATFHHPSTGQAFASGKNSCPLPYGFGFPNCVTTLRFVSPVWCFSHVVACSLGIRWSLFLYCIQSRSFRSLEVPASKNSSAGVIQPSSFPFPY